MGTRIDVDERIALVNPFVVSGERRRTTARQVSRHSCWTHRFDPKSVVGFVS